MTDQTTINPELLGQLTALLGKSQDTASELGDWSKPKASTGSAQITGVSIPIKVAAECGSVRVYLHFGAEHAASPKALMGLIDKLDAAGLPVDAWKASSGDDWGNNKKRNWR